MPRGYVPIKAAPAFAASRLGTPVTTPTGSSVGVIARTAAPSRIRWSWSRDLPSHITETSIVASPGQAMPFTALTRISAQEDRHNRISRLLDAAVRRFLLLTWADIGELSTRVSHRCCADPDSKTTAM